MILKNLHIVGKDNRDYDIITDDSRISDIRASGNEDTFSNDVKIVLNECIAFPGLINSHDHLEFNLYPRLGHKHYSDYVEWGNDIHSRDKELIEFIESVPIDLRMRYGVLKNLICGVTSVAHHGSYNSVLDDSPVSIIRKGTCIHSVKLGGKWKIRLNHPVSREPYVIHIGEGNNSGSCDEINELIRWNLFKRKLFGIHGISMTAEQSKNFTALIWCPDSNLFLFGKTADISALKKNTKILFGTDSTLTADGNIFENLRIARKLGHLSDEELFKSVTEVAAEAWGMNNIGKLTAGSNADIVIARQNSDSIFDSFYNTNPEDILLVIKDGKIILFDQYVKDVLPSEVVNVSYEKINVKDKIKFITYRIRDTLNSLKKLNLPLTLVGEN